MEVSRPRASRWSFWLAGVLTIAFYWAIFTTSLRHSMIARYTAEHTTEFAITFLFLWWLIELAAIVRRVRNDRKALRTLSLPPRRGAEPPENAERLLAQFADCKPGLRQTLLVNRLVGSLSYVMDRRSAEGLDEYLRVLADKDDDAVHSMYSLGRFVVCVSPILGFLGTVVHYGGALNSLDPTQIAERLPQITSSMGTAFDTTAAALTATMVAALSMFSLERVHHGVLRDVDDRVERMLAGRFQIPDPRLSPFLDALRLSSETNLSALKEVMREVSTLSSQRWGELQKASELLTSNQSASWRDSLRAQAEQFAAAEAARETRLGKLLDSFQQAQRTLEARMAGTVQQIGALEGRLAEISERLAGVIEIRGPLLALQNEMVRNLQVLHETQKFDEAVHGLTAAIHLLTARNLSGPARPHAA